MKKEEAIELKAAVGRLMYGDNRDSADYDALIGFIDSALRVPTREQVEKVWRGEWKKDVPLGYKCKSCGSLIVGKTNFCPECGKAMTDEAVEMVMERRPSHEHDAGRSDCKP